MEKTAYILLLIVALCWLLGMLFGMVAAFPFGNWNGKRILSSKLGHSRGHSRDVH